MSDRTKYFAAKEAEAKKKQEQDRREAEAHQTELLARVQAFTEAASVYEQHFAEVCEEFRTDGITSIVTRDSTVIRAVDPMTHQEYAGNVHLALKFTAGGTAYEIVYLGVQEPVLGMLAWRRNSGTYYVGQQSKATPTQLVASQHAARNHVDLALQAMQIG